MGATPRSWKHGTAAADGEPREWGNGQTTASTNATPSEPSHVPIECRASPQHPPIENDSSRTIPTIPSGPIALNRESRGDTTNPSSRQAATEARCGMRPRIPRHHHCEDGAVTADWSHPRAATLSAMHATGAKTGTVEWVARRGSQDGPRPRQPPLPSPEDTSSGV